MQTVGNLPSWIRAIIYWIYFDVFFSSVYQNFVDTLAISQKMFNAIVSKRASAARNDRNTFCICWYMYMWAYNRRGVTRGSLRYAISQQVFFKAIPLNSALAAVTLLTPCCKISGFKHH